MCITGSKYGVYPLTQCGEYPGISWQRGGLAPVQARPGHWLVPRVSVAPWQLKNIDKSFMYLGSLFFFYVLFICSVLVFVDHNLPTSGPCQDTSGRSYPNSHHWDQTLRHKESTCFHFFDHSISAFGGAKTCSGYSGKSLQFPKSCRYCTTWNWWW